MNVSNYNVVDLVNGIGTRSSLFLSGCTHMCKGCYNKKTWDDKFGYKYTKELEDKIIADLNDTIIKKDGISLSGGDPLYKDNLKDVYKLIKRIRSEAEGKTIWLWSGYTLIELQKNKNKSNLDMLRYIITMSVDVFIDGKFEADKYSPDLKWRGSTNQIIHTFK